MARQESDREDILREATALAPRAELRVAGYAEPVIVGFRREGTASVFFGQDPVFHFTSRDELRRAYVGGDLLKAERQSLIRLRRQRTAGEVQLVRSPLTPDEQGALLEELRSRLAALRGAIETGAGTIVAEQPPDGDALRRILAWLDGLPATIAVAQAPNVR